MSSNQKCGKWCACGRPAVWEIIEIGCQIALCDKDARADPNFKKNPSDFAWYEIPKDKQETEYATVLRGYNKTTTELAEGIHRLRFDVLSDYYGKVADELRRQASECQDEESRDFAELLEEASVTARVLQSQFIEMRALSLAKKERVKQK